jgi:hypothetical protein
MQGTATLNLNAPKHVAPDLITTYSRLLVFLFCRLPTGISLRFQAATPRSKCPMQLSAACAGPVCSGFYRGETAWAGAGTDALSQSGCHSRRMGLLRVRAIPTASAMSSLNVGLLRTNRTSFPRLIRFFPFFFSLPPLLICPFDRSERAENASQKRGF